MRPRGRSRRLLLFPLSIGVATASCDRTDLSGGRPPPGPDEPEAAECADPPSVTDLRGRLFINELMLENESTLTDETGAHPPWVELYNSTDDVIDASLVALSDDFLEATKWTLPCGPESVIPARGYLVIFVDRRFDELGGIHTNFRLPTTGRAQLLVNRGSDIVNVDASLLAPDRSAGRSPDGARTIDVLATPTPGAANSGPFLPPASMDADFVRGDADENGRVNVQDMSRIVQVLFEAAAAPPCRDRLDANDDGDLDLTDATFVGDALFRRGPPPPDPFPELGPDPTADDLECLDP